MESILDQSRASSVLHTHWSLYAPCWSAWQGERGGVLHVHFYCMKASAFKGYPLGHSPSQSLRPYCMEHTPSRTQREFRLVPNTKHMLQPKLPAFPILFGAFILPIWCWGRGGMKGKLRLNSRRDRNSSKNLAPCDSPRTPTPRVFTNRPMLICLKLLEARLFILIWIITNQTQLHACSSLFSSST